MDPFHVYLYGPKLGPIETTFEQAAERLQRLTRLVLEPDGSFVWAQDAGAQQVYGMIYDAAELIQYCELQGSCSHETWSTLCRAIVGRTDLQGFEVMKLPSQQLQDLQTFEQEVWPVHGH